MTPMHQPTEIKTSYHNITCDGTDIELTRFVEWFESKWLKEFETTLNISNVQWDNGHDVLRFETKCDIVHLSLLVQGMSNNHPSIFMMYDYYTGDDVDKYEEGVYWFYEGKMQSRPPS